MKRQLFSRIFVTIVSCLCFSFAAFPIPSGCGWCYQKIAQIALASICRFFLAFNLAFLNVYIPECYPLLMSSIGIAFTTSTGLVGAAISPYIISLSNSLQINPMVGFGLIGCLGMISSIFLAETFKSKAKYNVLN